MQVKIEASWKQALAEEFPKPYFISLTNKVENAYLTSIIYPPSQHIFNSFKLCPLPNVKVVILGQDPYHGAGQAEGLSFSVPEGQKIPPSLRNIHKEIESDLGAKSLTSGSLKNWSEQGVLLLNATLTVEAENPGSHQGLGWEQFTDAVIKKVSDEKENVVFILWGKYAQAKAELIDESKHLVLKAPHPSPFSAYTGFFDCKHFSKTNDYLKSTNQKVIVW